MTMKHPIKNGGVNNALVNIKCNPPLSINDTDLMNNLCDFIESIVNLNIKNQYVTHITLTEASEKGNKIRELTFQINW